MNTTYTQSTLDLPAVARRLSALDGPTLVLTHAKPDGDAFGSVVALVATLQTLGKTARGVLVPPIPRSLALQRGFELADVFGDDYELPFDPALCVIVDTGAWSQLGPMRRFIEPRLDRTLVLDHHLSGDIRAADRYVNGAAAAACEIIAELVELLLPSVGEGDRTSGRRETDAAGFKALPPVIREALFIGIASDTGWFRFSNTRPQTHELAAKLVRQGVDHAELYQRLEQCERPEKAGAADPGLAEPDLARRRQGGGDGAAGEGFRRNRGAAGRDRAAHRHAADGRGPGGGGLGHRVGHGRGRAAGRA